MDELLNDPWSREVMAAAFGLVGLAVLLGLLSAWRTARRHGDALMREVERHVRQD